MADMARLRALCVTSSLLTVMWSVLYLIPYIGKAYLATAIWYGIHAIVIGVIALNSQSVAAYAGVENSLLHMVAEQAGLFAFLYECFFALLFFWLWRRQRLRTVYVQK